MRRHNMLTAVIFVFLWQTVAAQYAWPTDAGRVITSSIGEYRPGHFHMGLDFKTWGREGYRVFAIEDGWIARIKTSPYGYGKALYLQLDDGRLAVYAHLSAYAPRLVPLLQEAQIRAGRYAVNLPLKRNLLRVRRGEVVGYTGSTGNGQPHLHMEIRERGSLALNPLQFYPRLVDTRAPEIIALAATPLTDSARVEGHYFPMIYPFANRQGVYHLSDTLRVQGAVGLALSSVDRANGAYNPFAAYRLRLFVDEVLVYGSQFDEVDYSQTHFVDEDYDFWLRANGLPNYRKLYTSDTNRLGFYRPDNGRLIPMGENGHHRFTALAPGLHRLRVEAEDYFGNLSRAQGWLRMETPAGFAPVSRPELSRRAVQGTHTWQWRLYGRWIHFTASNSKATPPDLLLQFSPWDQIRVALRLQPDGRWHGGYFWGERGACLVSAALQWPDSVAVSRESFFVMPVTADSSRILGSGDRRCSLAVPEGAVEEPLLMAVQTLPAPRGALLSHSYRFSPQDIRFRQPLRLSLDRGILMGETGVGIATVQDTALSWVKAVEDSSEIILAVRRLNNFTLVQDSTAPSIHRIQPADGQRIRDLRPWILVKFEDALSGCSGESNYRIRLDGIPLIVEHVPHQDLLKARPKTDLAPGEHHLEISLTDHAGNGSVQKSRFFVR